MENALKVILKILPLNVLEGFFFFWTNKNKETCNCEKEKMKLFKNVYITNIFYPLFYIEESLLFCVFLIFVQDKKNLPRCVLTVMSVIVLDYCTEKVHVVFFIY